MGHFRDDYRVLEISRKGAKGHVHERQSLLEKIAKQGLNIGGGGGRSSEIKIRLIEFGSKDQFLPYEAIVGTMLHELCHNEVGPHNAHFYTLLDKITLELEEHMAKGVTGTGEGFDAPSVGRLGGSGFGAHNPSPIELRSKMVQAAEARAKRAGLMPSGPRKMGGPVTHLIPREAAAAAAESRARDDAGCACGTKGGTSFTEAEVIQLESQPSSAATQEVEGTRDPHTQLLGEAGQSSASAAGAQGQSGTASESRYQQQGESLHRHEHQQRGEKGKEKHTREQIDMQDLIDLTADSDPEVDILE